MTYTIRKKKKKTEPFGKLAEEFGKQVSPYLVQLSDKAYREYSGSVICPKKKQERANCVGANDEKTLWTPRAGLMSLGPEVDEEAKIPQDQRLVANSWPWQTVPKDLLEKECHNEPFAGHFSGSIYENLFAYDALLWDGDEASANYPISYIKPSPKAKKLTNDEKIERRAKAAMAAAALIAPGYHTAVEISPTVRAYLGDEKVTHETACNFDQTSYITDLINEFIDKDKEPAKKEAKKKRKLIKK